MAEFNLKLTQGGAILLAKAKLGKQLNFKYITLGSGVYEGNPQEATAFVNKVIDLNIQEKTRKDTVAFLKATLTYNAVPDGFVWTELGVIAIDPDTQEEVLYMYDAIDIGEVIPPATSATQIEKVIQVASYVSNAPNISAVIDESLINIPKSDIGQPNGVAPLSKDGVLEIEYGGTNANNVQQAIYNLGVRPNKNLLCNWYFVNPVNQKGKIAPDGYGNGYGIDGWKNNKIAILRVNEDEGFITAFIDEVGGIILQKVPTLEIGKIYTLSVLAKNVSSVCGMGAWDGDEKKLQNGLTTHTFKAVQGTLDNGIYIIRKSQESETQASAVFYAAKLEEGSTQTLARKVANGTGIGGTSWELLETPDYSAELLKCQRYYQLYSSAENRPNSYIDCRPVMRKPDDGEITQGTIQINDVTYYYNSAEL